MKTIKYILLVAILVIAIAYVDIQINAMYSEPKILIFESFKLKFYETVKNVLK